MAKNISFFQKRANHLKLGQRGEDLACRLLEELGIKVLHRNFRHHHGEIDIIALDDEQLCFIEVKTRTNPYLFAPRKAVDRRKKILLISTSRYYLRHLSMRIRPAYRFDIIEVYRQGKKFNAIKYLRNAFRDRETFKRDY